ncbi:hypothetical protein A1O1_07439 [Capronia coronata CBS 617.96]|uniref:Myb-like DNA-binding domain-containing protein n=1 Tax=Capronia coronata CBS 617.96 TaxID=1182541 RepID=W9XTD3_9EURO|nr:uncharacterized protein A1O1_07439 [Capronia coronata CBS 617.96]EXJ83812.1 hypothetical protein A1O1_07439 [Capronia coronata CBS 617.96]
MAPTKTESDDFKFIMTCIKHSADKIKPNFEEVAKEMGAKSANACYHRHWGILRKWGLTGSKNGVNGAAGPTTPGKKRKATPSKADKATSDISHDDENPAKKRKGIGFAGGRKGIVKDEPVDSQEDELAISKEEEATMNEDMGDDGQAFKVKAEEN